MKLNKNYLLMILATFFWSGAFIAGKISTPHFPPFTLTFLRFVLATFFLYLYIRITGKKLFTLKLKDVPIFLFTGIVGMFGYHIFFFVSLKYTTAVNASIIGATNPMVTTLLAVFFLKDKMSLKKLLGIFISITGVLLTITNGNLASLINFSLNKGDLFMLLAVSMWAAYSVFSKKVCHKYSPIDLTFYSFLFCTVLLIPFTIFESPLTYLAKAPPESFLAIVYMSFFASFVGYLIQQICIKKIGASSTNIFINLVPVFSMILSFLFLREPITISKVLFAGMIIVGVYISQQSAKQNQVPFFKKSV